VICVPTPVDEFFTPDLTPLKETCAAVAEHAKTGQLLMLTSTTYVGCTLDLLVRPLIERGMDIGEDVFVAFSAERIEEGDTVAEQEAIPRVVGGATAACAARATEALGSFATDVQQVPSLAIAEMSKLLENTFRALNTAVSNEFADIRRSLRRDGTGRRLSPRS
jgi:nucleotide sugar dehydrogenase